MKYYRLSSKNGPAECELATFEVFNWFVFYDYIDSNPDRVISIKRGIKDYDDYKAVYFKSKKDLSKFLGTIEVNFKSPYNKNSNREKWFIELTYLGSAIDIASSFKEDDIEFIFNDDPKNITVRGIYKPTNAHFVSNEEISQKRNQQNIIQQVKIYLLEKKLPNIKEKTKPIATFTKNNTDIFLTYNEN